MKWIPATAFGGFSAFIATIIILKNHNLAPGFFGFFAKLPYHDKIGHFVLMGLLSLLAVLALTGKKRDQSPLRLASSLRILAILCILITLEEFSQIFVESRSFSMSDLGFSLAGAMLCGLLAHRLLHLRMARKTK